MTDNANRRRCAPLFRDAHQSRDVIIAVSLGNITFKDLLILKELYAEFSLLDFRKNFAM